MCLDVEPASPPGLKPGVSLDAAAAELRVIAQRVESTAVRRQWCASRCASEARLADEVIAPMRRSLWILLGAVGLVLAAACANVANLVLARMTVRAGEVVTRTALGAGTSRLVRQFLAEGLMLSLSGGLGGAVLAVWGTNLLVALGAAKIPRSARGDARLAGVRAAVSSRVSRWRRSSASSRLCGVES